MHDTYEIISDACGLRVSYFAIKVSVKMMKFTFDFSSSHPQKKKEKKWQLACYLYFSIEVIC
jgi:hypothetical protein